MNEFSVSTVMLLVCIRSWINMYQMPTSFILLKRAMRLAVEAFDWIASPYRFPLLIFLCYVFDKSCQLHVINTLVVRMAQWSGPLILKLVRIMYCHPMRCHLLQHQLRDLLQDFSTPSCRISDRLESEFVDRGKV